jgi:hypothetical protein
MWYVGTLVDLRYIVHCVAGSECKLGNRTGMLNGTVSCLSIPNGPYTRGKFGDCLNLMMLDFVCDAVFTGDRGVESFVGDVM